MLHDRHREEWISSCVNAQILEKNVWSIDDPREVDQLLNLNTDQRWKHSELAPGWAVAGVNPKTGERTFKGAQFKPDNPIKDPQTGKFRKYLSPAKQTLSPLFLETEDPDYWAKLLTNFTMPIVLTEGAKKAGAILSQGLPTVSIPGVSTGGKLGRLRPELEMFCRYGRKIYLAFDRDIVQKLQVQRALHNLGRMIAAAGAMVYVLEWDNRFKGADDFIRSGGDFKALIYEALTLEEWKEKCEEQELPEQTGKKCDLAVRYEMVEAVLKGRLRWNNLKSQVELDGSPVDPDSLRLYLALKHNVGLPIEDCQQICNFLAKKETFSPVAEYLKQCGQQYGADSDLLDSLTRDYLGTDEPLHRCYLRKTLISAVARALTPGCKVDTVCILSGGQGVGKSTFWKILASEDWFDDTVGSTSDKDERLKLHQAWFIEWAELEAVFKRKDISAVKAFITTQSDQIRPPYGRSVESFDRPSIIVGSTNESEFLGDPTGNRRYWVIPVSVPAVPLEQLAADRDRIWAAAYHAFMSGERWELPSEFRQIARADSQNYVFSDPWEEAVLVYCQDVQKVTTVEILVNALRIDLEKMDKRSEMRVSSILKVSGWRNQREYLGGRRVRVWYPPIEESEPAIEESVEEGGVVPLEGVVPSHDTLNSDSPKFTDLGCPGCPIEAETQSFVVGQPMGQPMGQPPGQPPDFSENEISTDENLDCYGTTGQPGQPLSRSSRTIDNCIDPDKLLPVEINDLKRGDYFYVLDGKGQWVKAKFDKPSESSVMGSDRKLHGAFWFTRRGRQLKVAEIDIRRAAE